MPSIKQAIRSVAARARQLSEHRRYNIYTSDHIFDVRVNRHKFLMSFSDYPIQGPIVERIEGRREPDTVAIIEAIAKPGMQILEIGGCYGYFTLIMSSCAGPNGRVVTIEGTPRNYDILKKNIEINQVTNVDPFNVFVTSQDSEVRFAPDERSPYAAIDRLTQPGESLVPEEGSHAVPTVTVSGFLKEESYHPDVIFMDIEGFETEVIEDLSRSYLSTHRPTFVFEVHPTFYEPDRGEAFIVDSLQSLGYECRRVGGNMIAHPVSAPSID